MSEVPPPPPTPVSHSDRPTTTESAGQVFDEGRGRIFPCDGCGADLEFHIGNQSLTCPYCGHVKAIEISEDAAVEEQDFKEMLRQLETWKREREEADEEAGGETRNEIRCDACGGNVEFIGTLTSTHCPYCDSPVQLENAHKASDQRIPVDGVLAFQVEKQQASENLKRWVASRWFAPNKFRREGVSGKFNGVYLSYYTYDSMTFTRYSGRRGEYYYVTVGTGKNKRRERRTRWYPASGRFQRFFDDVLVLANTGLRRDFMQALEPWPLQKVVPFNQQMLAGCFARTYDIALDDGFEEARGRIDSALRAEVRSRIGGDTQRIDRVDSRYDAVTCKHLLLPVWLLAYRYGDKTYQVFINAATGEVQGERPYSWLKITFAVLFVIAVIGVITLASQS